MRRSYRRGRAVTGRAISDSLATQTMIAASNIGSKGDAMAQPFIFIGTYTIKEGKLEEFKRYWPQFVEFVEENEPRLIAFNAYVGEDGSEVGIVQVHPDVDSMEFHMKLIREHVEQAFAEYLAGTVGMQIYGMSSESALETIEQMGGQVPSTVKPLGIGGFTRSAAERARSSS